MTRETCLSLGKRAKRLMDLYIEHREAFEGKIKNLFPIIYEIRRAVTIIIKVLRAVL